MSTRAAIVRINGEHGFKGRYHHWDGYPSGLGATLFNLYRGQFKRDLPAMLHVLIDKHKAGWSTINGANFNLEPGYFGTQYAPCETCGLPYDEHFSQNLTPRPQPIRPCDCGGCADGIHWLGHKPTTTIIEDHRPHCFCHGERHGEAWLVNEKNAAGSGVEYVYMFTEDRKMHILSSYCADGAKMIGWFGMGDSKAAWRIVRTIELDSEEPDWDMIDKEAA